MALQAFRDELASTAAALAAPGTGLLAADESTGTIGKRFDATVITETRTIKRNALDTFCFCTLSNCFTHNGSCCNVAIVASDLSC